MTSPITERCQTLRELIPSSAPILYFLHVPKTAGTHLAITLQESHKVNVFSLDSTDEGFASRVHWYRPERPTFVRSHLFWTHAYANFLKHFPNTKVFSILRSPYALHFSMASMIRDRALKMAADQPTASNPYIKYLPDGLESFSRLESLDQVASILAADRYKTEYSSIYTRYFGYVEENEPSPLNACYMMPISQVDNLLKAVLHLDTSTQERRNQSAISSTVSPAQLLNSGILELIQDCIPQAELATYRMLQAKTAEFDLSRLTSSIAIDRK
jgi:hypothetical protein